MTRIACVVMQRNESRCLAPFLAWHGHLFGPENLFVIDHGSEHPGVREALAQAEARGTHIFRLPAAADYREKGTYISTTMARLDATRRL